MNWLNHKAENLRPGAIRGMFDKAMKLSGVISLGIGEPDMPTPGAVCRAGIAAIEAGHTHYTANAGLIEFRRAVADSQLVGTLKYNAETEVMSTVGAMGGLSLALSVTLEEGDEVMLSEPIWLNYAAQIRFAGGVPVYAKTGLSMLHHVTAEEIKRKITSKTKILLINSPCNPTGAVLGHEELKEIAKVVIDHGLLVISDEVYSTLVYDGIQYESIASMPGMKDRTIMINSMSKSFAMTGWRVGFAAGPSHIIEKMTRLQENVNACVPAASQYAAIYALSNMGLAADIRDVYSGRRRLIVEGLNRIRGFHCNMPEGTFYAFADVHTLGVGAGVLCNRLLEEGRVVAIPGSCFGESGEGFVRFSFANSTENIEEALNRIDMFVSKMGV